MMEFNRNHLTDGELLEFYKALLIPRLIELKMLNLLRQGKVSKWFSGIGQEAISVGTALALEQDELIFPLIRNLGIFTTRKVPLQKLFSQFQGKKGGFTKGRDRSFHFGSLEHSIVGMISHLGPQLALANGAALHSKLNGSKKIAVAFSGDGGTSEGDFHEALNVAAVWDLPVIFVIENNRFALSTFPHEQYRCDTISSKAVGYGMETIQIDGNNLLEVYHTITRLRKELIENPRPILLEAHTFRMRGHEEASGTKYIPKEMFSEWERKDPIECYKNFLFTEGLLTESTQQSIAEDIKYNIEYNWTLAEQEPEITPNAEEELADVYKDFDDEANYPTEEATRELRFISAVSEGLQQAMVKFPQLVLMGQDIAEYGGVFKITDGFVAQFGKSRVRNTPLCESAVIGTGLGYSLCGGKAMVEMQFSDFVTCGFNQIVNNLAKLHYRWGANADVVIRMPSGGGVGAGPFHSQSTEAWFTHTPGLKIAYPSNPFDAKGLLIRAFEDPNPVLFFEHKALYRSVSGLVPEQYYSIPFGEANIVKEGNDITIITYGMGVHWALSLVKKLPQVSVEIIDLRTLIPLDRETIFTSVRKTGKALVLHEDIRTGGFGADIVADVQEFCFHHLDAPVMRVTSMDTPVPFAVSLEQEFLAVSALPDTVLKLAEY